ncbi:aminopeptidase [Riemerella anatipestifer]|nr:aminopeptidase [Riemerella anatipestifer]
MNKALPSILIFLFSILSFAVKAQQDSVWVKVSFPKTKENRVIINQKIVRYQNEKSDNLQLLNWIAAYQPKNTTLAKRMLEARKTDLYFSKPKDRGYLKSLNINGEKYTNLDQEIISVPLGHAKSKDNKIELNLTYELQLPHSKYTGIGWDSEKEKALLKYFFLVPNTSYTPRHFQNLDEKQYIGIFWDVQLDNPLLKASSNLQEVQPNHFTGTLNTDPEFAISLKNNEENFTIIHKNTLVEFAYPIKQEEKQSLYFYVPLQLNFIEESLGKLPNKILISERTKNENNFTGIDDFKLGKFKLKMFSDAQKTDLNYFSIISKKCVEHLLQTDNLNAHWIENGLKTYLEIRYLKTVYNDEKLLGQLPDKLTLFKISPLKWSNASKLKLTERYGITYQYITSQNIDQPIDTPLQLMSNFNTTAISQMEVGSLFNFIAEKMGVNQFNNFLKRYLSEHNGTVINKEDFLNQLIIESKYSANFAANFIRKKNRLDFKIKKVEKQENRLLVHIHKNTEEKIPFQLKVTNSDNQDSLYWYDSSNKKKETYLIPQTDVEKIVINDDYLLPEYNVRNNYLYTKGIFYNMKKPKLKFYTDIPNPEYKEIYISPWLNYNFYDKVLIGSSISNSNLLDRPFLYSVTPYYSTGTNKLTGSASVSYNILPPNSFFQNWRIGASAAYFHYNKDLAFRRLSIFSNISLSKEARSQIDQKLGVSFQHLTRDLSPLMQKLNDYDEYNLFNINYTYSDRKAIHEKLFSTNFQMGGDFSKISAEAFYRWEYQQNKKLILRFFGGYFLQNQTRNSYFDFGISSLSNYSFTYSIIRQSNNNYLAPRQFVMAEGAFKSAINDTANQWINSVNIDLHSFRFISVYADIGLYKNKNQSPRFIWDTGASLKVIPDLFEIYFPLQSSLGFEPSFKDYSKRIRFMFNFNLNAVVNQLRRGWF